VDSASPAGGTCGRDDHSGTVPLAVADVESPAAASTLSVASSNPALVPSPGASSQNHPAGFGPHLCRRWSPASPKDLDEQHPRIEYRDHEAEHDPGDEPVEPATGTQQQ
jgi:hypothetical protein